MSQLQPSGFVPAPAPEPALEPTPALALQGICQQFGATQVLRGLSLQIQPGERVALIGPNGAGKSTLFDVLSGRRSPSAGQFWLNGQPASGLAPQRLHRLGLARSFQVSSLFAKLTVAQNLRCAALHAAGVAPNFWQRLSRLGRVNTPVEAMLAELGLLAQRHTPAQHLSYAEQRRLELGLTLIGGASVVLLDEPTAGMSRSETEQTVALLRRLTQGKTLLMVEHDMAVVFNLADRIAVLEQGQLIAFDTPAAVRANPQVQRAYLGGLEGLPT